MGFALSTALLSGCASPAFKHSEVPITQLSGHYRNLTVGYGDGSKSTTKLNHSASWYAQLPTWEPQVFNVGFSHDPLLGASMIGISKPSFYAGLRWFYLFDFGLDAGVSGYGAGVNVDWNLFDNVVMGAGIWQPLKWTDFFTPWDAPLLGVQVSIIP